MRRLLVVVGILFLVGTTTAIVYAATNLNSSKSNIYREVPDSKLTTETVNLTNAGETETVVTAPATGNFLLTQACVSAGTGGILIAATGFGPIAQLGGQGSSASSGAQPADIQPVSPSGGGACQTFTPGMLVPKSSAITCSTSSTAVEGNYFCTISALLVGG